MLPPDGVPGEMTEECFATSQHVELQRAEALLLCTVEHVGHVLRANRFPDMQADKNVARLNPSFVSWAIGTHLNHFQAATLAILQLPGADR